MTWFAEICAMLIQKGPHFKGKGRLIHWWMKTCRCDESRERGIGSSSILCDLSVPYEAMVWLEQEEEEDLGILRSLLEPEGLFVDVGANIGLWSIVAAEEIGRAHVVAFEPNPATFEKLSENARRGAPPSAMQLLQCAVGASDGQVALNCSYEHNISSIFPVPASNGTCIVPMRALDSYLEIWPRVQGIKIDAEGSELEALEGAPGLLRRDRPWLVVEFNTELAGRQELAGWAAHELLSSMGYEARLMRDAVSREGAPLRPEWQTAGYCNLFYSMPRG